MATILSYKQANSQNSGSKYFAFTLEYDTGPGYVTLYNKVYYRYSGVPYYQWQHTVKIDCNGSSLVNKTGQYPSASGDWGSCSVSINGTTYQRVYTAASATYSLDAGGTVGCSCSYSVSGSATYLPVKGTYSNSGNVSIPTATGVVDVNPVINGTEQASGLSGFTFNLSGPATASGQTDYYNSSAPVGTYTATPVAKTGYTTSAASGTLSKGATLTLKPTWTINSYTVTVRRDSSSRITDITSPAWGWTGTLYKQSTVNYGTSVTFNVSLATGYHFTKWSGSNTSTTIPLTVTITGAYDITANSAANTYTVSYNGNGNTGGSTASSSHTYDTAKALTTNGFTKTGYSFSGWNTKSDGSGTAYANGASVKNLTSTNGGTVTLYAQWTINQYYLDLNGWLDGASSGSLGVYGTADVTVAGTKVGTAVTDYYKQHNYGSSYSITNIKANTGYQYNGVYSGSVSGTMGASTTAVVLNFSTTKPSNVVLTANTTGPFGIDTSWSATGVNISYTLYYKKSTESTYTSIAMDAATSKSLTVDEETTYNIYVAATNNGGTTNSNTVTLTTPADQAKIRIKKDGAWVKGKTYFKKNGEWVKAKKIYIKVNGEWKIGNNYDPGEK